MSFDMLKAELQSLPAEVRRKLLAFMAALEDQARDGYAAKLAGKIDDKPPERSRLPSHESLALGGR